MRVYVGTANWGKPYGMNQVKVSDKEIDKILCVAYAGGCGIETAWDYDCMEELRGLGEWFKIILKVDEINQSHLAEEIIGKNHPMKHHPPYDGWSYKSIYSLSDYNAEHFLEVPLNIVDQRWVNKRTKLGIIARSVFMQGLAFTMPDFHGVPFYHICWNFVRNNPNIDGIVVGVDSAKQLEDILNIPQYEIDYSKIGSEGWIKTL